MDYLIVLPIEIHSRKNDARIDAVTILISQLQFSSVVDNTNGDFAWGGQEGVVGSQYILSEEWISEDEVIEKDLIELVSSEGTCDVIDLSFTIVVNTS